MNPVAAGDRVCVALAPIVLEALRPQYVSFLVGMKQYAGNWASGTFSFRDKSMEDRINERIVKAADNQIDQLDPLFGNEISEIFIQKAVAFRMMHPMGRMHISALMRHTDGLDDRIQGEGEFVSNVLTGWNFGDGLPRRAPDRGAARAMPVRTGRRGGRLDRVAAGLQQEGAVPGDRRRARHGREGGITTTMPPTSSRGSPTARSPTR